MNLIFRNGTILHLDAEEASSVAENLKLTSSKFIGLKGQIFNTVEIIGLVNDDVADEMEHKRRGDWLCRKDSWHKKGRECDCRSRTLDDGKKIQYGTGEVPGNYLPHKIKKDVKSLADSKRI